MPVGVFIAAAVRFGGERRDRRLAALRLVGADSRMTRRIAAGEALAGAVLGLVFGTGFFLIGRQIAGSVEVFGVSVFPSYLNPTPVLAVLVAVAVPAAAVAVTLLALRGVVIEPLGVVRTARPARRRLWWRLLLPLGGIGLLVPMIGKGTENGNFNEYMVTGGVILLLVGVTALLPWIVEAVVARLNSGPVSWQLAVRRLQLSSGTAARMVNGIAVAVAGAIALQMLFAGVAERLHGAHRLRPLARPDADVRTEDRPTRRGPAGPRRDQRCAPGHGALRRLAGLGQEGPRDVHAADRRRLRRPARGGEAALLPRGGRLRRARRRLRHGHPEARRSPAGKLYIDPSYSGEEKAKEVAWTVPRGIKKAGPGKDPKGCERGGFLFTPSALPTAAASTLDGQIYLQLDMSVPDVQELVRNTAAKVDPLDGAPGRTRRARAPDVRLHPHRPVRRRGLCSRADRGEPARLAAGAAARAQEAAVGPRRLRHPAPHTEPVGAVADRDPGRPRPGRSPRWWASPWARSC